jgi:3'-phosphoadenosine 5'-phosphosulfate sulfotransferase (PAPS reductase)/FAD synthetase
MMNLTHYDFIIVAFSGGKDSTACILHLLSQGVPAGKIEVWHHLVDGREGSTLMDWPITESYVKKFAAHFGLKLCFSWKHGGFEKEMLRENSLTSPISFYDGEGNVKTVGGVRGKKSTRRKFPQVSGDLRVRWCTSYLKIDVCTAAIINQERFLNKKTLLVSGERAAESPRRATYKEFEMDRADNRGGKRISRHVDRWRPVLKWSESDVWDIIKRFGIIPHPAYRVGFGRVSCMTCIFGSDNQWATVKKINPLAFSRISGYEKKFGVTIRRAGSIEDAARKGNPYSANRETVEMALSRLYPGPIVTDTDWQLPAGAFGENAGPT